MNPFDNGLFGIDVTKKADMGNKLANRSQVREVSPASDTQSLSEAKTIHRDNDLARQVETNVTIDPHYEPEL